MPSEPVSMEASSERMSPKVFSVTSTSNCAGLAMSCIAALSTYMSSRRTSGYSAAMLCATSRHMRDVSSTLALSTECTTPRRRRAASKAQRTTRSTSYSEYSRMSRAYSPRVPPTPAPSTPIVRS